MTDIKISDIHKKFIKFFFILLIFVILLILSLKFFNDKPHITTDNGAKLEKIPHSRGGGGKPYVDIEEGGAHHPIISSAKPAVIGYINRNEKYFLNKEKIKNNKIEYIYGEYEYYGSFDIKKQLLSFNYLYASIILLIFSIFILFISSEVWLKYKIVSKRKVLERHLNRLIEERGFYIDNINKIPDKNSSDKIDAFYKKISEVEENIKKIQFSNNNNLKENFIYIAIGIIVFCTYISIPNYLKGIPFEYLYDEFFNYTRQYVPPFIFVAILFSLISFVRLILVQGGSEDKRMNRFSFFGIILSIIDLSACLITIYLFFKY